MCYPAIRIRMCNPKTNTTMKNYYSTTTRNSNCFTSADGKRFDAQDILDKVNLAARRFARAKGHSLREEDIEDIAMEAIMKVQTGYGRYDSSRPMEPWLRAIVFREGCDLLRKEIRETEGRRRMLDEMDGEPYGDYADAHVIRKENRQQFYRYLASIQDGQKRECMRLAGLEHWKPAEIAKELGWPSNKVHRMLCREKKKLEDM